MRTLRFSAPDVARGPLILINPSHPLRTAVSRRRLAPVGPAGAEILLDSQAARMLSKVLGLLNCGPAIVPVSGYRTLPEQQALYAEALRAHGPAFTQQYVALPGCSEHQAGLAVDLAENSGSIDPLRPSFPYTGLCARFRALAGHYGFIERYPAGRESLTRIAHEPWHFRYVGYPHSHLMTTAHLTLEEYTDYLKQFTYPGHPLRLQLQARPVEIYFVPVPADRAALVEVPHGAPCLVSGNNVDGVVVTLWHAPP